uniref:TROVE domain-containing protein n=1 Tax=Aegilops tauschii subsp. strangulata TaxID=200361 RepID=A0A453GX23_AEGTS
WLLPAPRSSARRRPSSTPRWPTASPPPRSRHSSTSSDGYSDSDDDEPQRKPTAHAPAATGRALAYASSGDPCVDFFFQVVPGATAAADVAALLGVAWAADARTALRLVCHLRGVRGLGKADREGFYAAALWMHANHPRTLAANLGGFARFGCLKDLPEILYRVLHGPRDERKDQDDVAAAAIQYRRGGPGGKGGKRRCVGGGRAAAAETAKARREKEAEHAQAVLARYDSDEAFRKLYDGVADLFAGLLKSDLEHLRAGETAKIGLAAKWCPSLRSSYDRATLLCEAIARRVFPRDSSPEYLAIPDKHYAYRVRSRLRREVQVPLRKVLELPEVYMIPADAVLPHVIVAAALKGEHDESAELQWRHMVSSLASEGRLTNCIAMCALSGTSDKPPAAAAIALGLLISELSQDPWKGRVITFDATHQLHKVRGASLVEKLRPLAAVTPQRGANLQAVFNKILKVAVAGALAKDQMVRRVFVLSDMEFDGWTGGEAWVSEHEAIRKRFAAEGFAAPEVVFWNVGGTSKAASPVVAAQAGVALVSGYSKNLVRLFLEADGVLTPSAIMADAISGPEYDALEVLD